MDLFRMTGLVNEWMVNITRNLRRKKVCRLAPYGNPGEKASYTGTSFC